MESNALLKTSEQAVFALRSLYNGYGYQLYKMNRFEEYELYVRNKDFLVSDEVITFTDRSGRLLALKPDVTLSIIKNMPEHPGQVQKLYYNENVYRVDGGTHCFKEIMQSGLECVGDLGSYEIAEVVLLAAQSLSRLSENYVLGLSHMGLLSAILGDSGLSDTGKQQVLTCLQQKNAHELRAVCQRESLAETVTEKLLVLTDCFRSGDGVLPVLEEKLTADTERVAFCQLRDLYRALETGGYAGHIEIDFSVTSDLKYYSGVVFSGYIPGIPECVLSGGQYDKLLRKMGKSSSAVGFAIYVDLLEGLGEKTPGFDVDTLVLYDRSMPADRLLSAVAQYRTQGTVLVAAALPEGRTWRHLADLRGKGTREYD